MKRLSMTCFLTSLNKFRSFSFIHSKAYRAFVGAVYLYLLQLAGGHPAIGQTRFIPLGYLDGFGPTSEAAAMSDSGTTIVGYSTTTLTSNQATIWTASSPGSWLVDGRIDLLSGTQNWYSNGANSLSANGQVAVGTRSFDTTEEAFFWTPEGQIQLVPLPTDTAEPIRSSQGWGVSSNGNFLVGHSVIPVLLAFETRAWFWDRGQAKAVWLPPLGGTTVPNRGAFGVSANGSQVVGWAQASLTQQAAVMWTHGGAPVVLHKTGDTVLGLSALSISPDGSVVAGFAYNAGTGKNTAFKWTESGGMVALSPPTTGTHALTYTTAVRVSANGRVIVGYGENVLGNEEAVFWVDEQPFRVSDIAFAAGALPASWEPFRAYGVDATGNSISGYGRATSGKIEAYVLVLDASYIPPQPPPPPLPIIKSAFIEGSLSIRFVGVPGIDYRIRGGKNLKTWNTLDDWKEGTGQEVLFATIPDLSDSGYFIQVEARAD